MVAGNRPGISGMAGGHTVNITPPHPMPGYYGTVFTRGAEDSDVLCHATVFTDGAAMGAVVSADLTAVDRATVLRIREECELKTGIPGSHVFVAANHAHSAPHAAPMFLYGAHPDPLYVDFFITRAVQAIAEAKNKLRAARFVAGNVPVPDTVFNRRLKRADGTVVMTFAPNMNPSLPPAGPVDDAVGYIMFEGVDDGPIACVLSFACHNHAAGGGVFHRDLGGRAGDVMRRRLGADIATPFLEGACGDVMWLDPRAGTVGSSALAWRIGERLADAVLGDCSGKQRQDIDRLRFASEVLAIPDRPLTESEFCEDNCRGTDLASLHFAQGRYLPERLAVQERGATGCVVEIGAISIGDAAISANPAELFCALGLEIKKRSPFPVTMISELTNGYCGYVPTEAAFDEKGYETHRTVFTSRLAKNGGRVIVEKSVEMLRRCTGSNQQAE